MEKRLGVTGQIGVLVQEQQGSVHKERHETRTDVCSSVYYSDQFGFN